MRWSRKQLEQLAAAGKIKGWDEQKRSLPSPAGRIVAKVFKKKSKEKQAIETELLTWCNERALKLNSEYYFAKPRMFRFDWAIPEKMIAIEYEGLMSKKSRHTTISGFTKDTVKYNLAQQLGWKVFRYTALTYQNLINDLNHGH